MTYELPMSADLSASFPSFTAFSVGLTRFKESSTDRSSHLLFLPKSFAVAKGYSSRTTVMEIYEEIVCIEVEDGVDFPRGTSPVTAPVNHEIAAS